MGWAFPPDYDPVSADPLSFRYYAEPSLSSMSPATGPAYGVQCAPHECSRGIDLGTLVRVTGANLASGEPGNTRRGYVLYIEAPPTEPRSSITSATTQRPFHKPPALPRFPRFPPN